MNIINFLYFTYKTHKNIHGILIPKSFREGRHVFNNLVKLIAKDTDIIRRRGDLFDWRIENGSSFTMFCYNENLLCGRRGDFVINCNPNLDKKVLPPLFTHKINEVDRGLTFLYDGCEDRFLFLGKEFNATFV